MTRKKKKNYDMSPDDAQDIKQQEIDKAINFANSVEGGFDSHVRNSICKHIQEFTEMTKDEYLSENADFVRNAMQDVFGKDHKNHKDIAWDHILFDLVEKSAWGNVIMDVFVAKIHYLENKIKEMKKKTDILNRMPDDIFNTFMVTDVEKLKAFKNDVLSVASEYERKAKKKKNKKSTWQKPKLDGKYQDYYKMKFKEDENNG